jgi:hypothetical protein
VEDFGYPRFFYIDYYVPRNYVITCNSYIIGEFNISYNTSSWMLTAYLIAGAVMTPIGVKAVRNGRYYYLL